MNAIGTPALPPRLPDARALLAALPVGVALYDEDRRLLLANPSLASILGIPPGTFRPLSAFADHIRLIAHHGLLGPGHPEAQTQTILDNDTGHERRYRRRHPDGRSFDSHHVPMPDGGLLVCLTDTTNLVAMRDEAEQAASRVHAAVASLRVGLAVFSPAGRLELHNRRFSKLLGLAPTALDPGIPLDDLLHRIAARGDLPALNTLLQTRRPAHIRLQRDTGTVIDVQSDPLPEGGWTLTVTDATPGAPTGVPNPTATPDAIHTVSRADTLEAMLAHIRHGIILWDRHGRIVAANPVVAAMLNAPEGFLVPGRTLAEVTQSALDRGNLGDGQPARIRARWLLEQDRTQSHIDQRTTRDGRVLEVRTDPASSGGFVTTYTDITPVRQAEHALRLAKSAAEAANAAKSRFLATMSNELRTPLTTILHETAAIARDAADQIAATRSHPARSLQNRIASTQPRTMDALQAADSADIIGTAARTLLGHIDTILDVARLEAGRFGLADDQVDLPQVVRAVLRRQDPAAAAAEVALVVDLPEHLPLIRADERRLREALGHIVANAVKFTGPLGSVSIAIRQDWTTGALLIEVTDTGPGLEPGDIDRIFEPFAQIGDTTPAGGLGLYISRTLMRAHGGDLTLRSTIGQGTAATIHIPPDRVLQDAPRDTN